MESSQNGQVNRHRKELVKSSTFGSVSGSGACINLQTLEHCSPPKNSTNVSPANYFGARRPAYVGDMVDSQAQVDGNYGMGQIPDAGFHGQGAPEKCNQVCVYQDLVVTSLGRYSKACRMVVNENWRYNLSIERSSTMDLAVGSLNPEKSLCDKLASPSVHVVCVA